MHLVMALQSDLCMFLASAAPGTAPLNWELGLLLNMPLAEV